MKCEQDLRAGFVRLQEELGEDIVLGRGLVRSGRFYDSTDDYKAYVKVSWNISSSKGESKLYIQQSYNPDPAMNGTVFLKINDVKVGIEDEEVFE